MTVKELIYQQIKREGDLAFVDYMHQALYSPVLGYYSSGLQKFGAQGDFITAPERSPLFGFALANQCQQIIAILPHSKIFEFGAGSGRLCVDILKRLQSLDALPDEYLILEVSGALRMRQQELIDRELPEYFTKIRWLESWPEEPFNGIVIANEVLDAMPVHRFKLMGNELQESYISLDAMENLCEVYKPTDNARLVDYITRSLPPQENLYISEANLFLEGWLQECYKMLTQGMVLLIDYGFPRHEYYHPDRDQGTLMCHYYHQAHTNVLAHPGEEDITAHVDFTHVAEAGRDAGFHVAGYCNQASFLLGNGLLDLLQSIQNERERFHQQQAVKQLVQEHEMGELFKVIALTKKVDIDLMGFQLQDKRASL